MEGWQIAIVLKPFALVILFGFTFFLSRWIKQFIPEGKFKRFLFFSWKV